MPFVKEGPESDPRVASLYGEINDTLQIGRIPNILRTTTADPEIARWFWDGVKVILLRESRIPRALKESIAVVVSDANSCRYCSQAHAAVLRFLGFSDEQVADLRGAREKFSEKERAALSFALKINNSAHKTTGTDHEALRDHGYDDGQIVEIASVAAAFSWANIIADALGTELEQP